MAMALNRREFLLGAAVAGGAAATGALGSVGRAFAGTATTTSTTLPAPAKSGIEHVVVLCMENRSFDHFLGWVPNADGKQAGLTYLDDSGAPHDTHRLTEWQGCGVNDPDPSYDGGRPPINGGGRGGVPRGRQHDL